MGTIVTASLTGKAKVERGHFLKLLTALAQDHYADGPYFVVSGPSSHNLDPFLGTDALRHMPDAKLLVDNASIEQVHDAVMACDHETNLVIGFGWVRANDDWDLDVTAAESAEERAEIVQELQESVIEFSDACGALYHCGQTAELRIVGKAAPAELEYGDKTFFEWLEPWLGKVRHRVHLD